MQLQRSSMLSVCLISVSAHGSRKSVYSIAKEHIDDANYMTVFLKKDEMSGLSVYRFTLCRFSSKGHDSELKAIFRP
ncbi:hypothetical protein L6452_39475 [Arctium lappa]|uniref:Uncharacterized protein n=1 Tax=Arctium lappa TaxID=4217 RepID=A0ACB8XRR9_ARCLA|nr:hypothetical protein L6452_39475 [Arctium lappa]